jgi:hypothetical protein
MVLKIGPDRPVQPETGTWFGPVSLKNQKLRKKTIKTDNRRFNRKNREPAGSTAGLTTFKKIFVF